MSADTVQADREAEIRQRQRKAAELIRSWMAEDDGYDERVWPILDAELKKDRFRLRDDDEPGA